MTNTTSTHAKHLAACNQSSLAFWPFTLNNGEPNLRMVNMFAATWTFARSWCPAFLILIPHEDKVDVLTPFNILVIGGGKILISHEDKVDVISPINILFRGGGEFWSLMNIKLMLLPHSTLVIGGGEFESLMKIKLVLLSQSTYCPEGVANFDPSWR